MKATNREIIESIEAGHDTFYRFVKKFPEARVLWLKGIIADKMINKEILDTLIKTNKEET